jgi:hypothetical protein
MPGDESVYLVPAHTPSAPSSPTPPELPSAVNAGAIDVQTGKAANSFGRSRDSPRSLRSSSFFEVIGLPPPKTAWAPGESGGDASPKSCSLDLHDLAKVAEHYKLRMTKKRLKEEFHKLVKICDRDDGKMDGQTALDWVRYQSQQQRRQARKVARSLFMVADDDNSGFLVREEVADLTEELKAIYPEYEIDPPLNLDVRTSAALCDANTCVCCRALSSCACGRLLPNTEHLRLAPSVLNRWILP